MWSWPCSHSRNWRWLFSVLAVTAGLGSALSGCTTRSSGDVSSVATSYLGAWRRHDYRAMTRLTYRPPADFAAFQRTLITDLGVRNVDFVAGRPRQNGNQA